MNSFTKDELCRLLDALHDHYMRDGLFSDTLTKLDLLIDNYCEHDWREAMCQQCDKCDALKEY